MTAIAIGGLLILAGQQPVGKGVILGTLFSILNFILIGETLPLKLGKTKGKTFFVTLGSIILRYGLMALPLILAVKLDQFSVLAVVFGIFMIQIMIITEPLVRRIVSIWEKQV